MHGSLPPSPLGLYLPYVLHSTPSVRATGNTFVPGFIRVEPGMGDGGELDGDTWVEWEIMLSRFFPIKVDGAGTYIALRKSLAVSSGGQYGGNNQVICMLYILNSVFVF